jgi:Zn-dependent M28 family amino/carboxypeptidase
MDILSGFLPSLFWINQALFMPGQYPQLEQVQLDNISRDVVHLSSYPSRAVGSTGNQQVTQWLVQRFVSMGYAVNATSCFQPNQCNVIADKAANQPSNLEALLVIAHFDSVGAAYAGADDNASGVAVMLEIARIISQTPMRHTVRFIAANGEENGLLGSRYYVNQQRAAQTIHQIKFVINMDMVGYNANGIVELETQPVFSELANWYASLVRQYTNLRPKITLNAWGSNHVPFLDRNIPALLTIEDWDTKTPCYHRACDLPDTLNYPYATQIAKLNLAALLDRDRQ